MKDTQQTNVYPSIPSGVCKKKISCLSYPVKYVFSDGMAMRYS